MDPADLVAAIRRDAHLSVRALAEAAGVAASTVHRVERGTLHPTVDTLKLIAEAAGMRLHVEARPDYAASVFGLGRAIADPGEEPVRMAAELVGRYCRSDAVTQARMLAAEPPPTGDQRWDAFLGALGEWLAVTSGRDAPPWTRTPSRFLDRGWWVTSMAALRAWEYAGSPAAFKIRGVYLHRDSLVNV